MYLLSWDDDGDFLEPEALPPYRLLRRNNQLTDLRFVAGGHNQAYGQGTSRSR
jgi:hypothetical protein